MGSGLLQAVYLSKAARPLADADVASIHESARRNNQRSGVTGLLLYDGGRFIQALEGDAASVEETLERIVADDRHKSIQIASKQEIAERQFGTWAMDCRRTPPGTCSQQFLAQVKEDIATVADPSLQAAFIGFAYLAVN